MKPFTYIKINSEEEILASRATNAKFLAGGTNLLDLMKKHIAQPDVLLDVNAALDNKITKRKDGIRIGAAVKNSVIANHPNIKSDYPLLAQAILKGASPQIRNMASTAGNLMQRTRCPYFYDTALPCNKREKGSGCGAKDGDNRVAAIIGYSESCVAVHPSDMCVALAALDAKVEFKMNDGREIVVPFTDFHRLPESDPTKDNILTDYAWITAVHIPENKFHKNCHYLKLRDRDSYAFALISVAAALELDGNTIVNARLASGGVAHKPWRWTKAETFLKGKTANESNFEQAAEMVIADVKPLQHNQFKVPMLRGGIVEAMKQCLG